MRHLCVSVSALIVVAFPAIASPQSPSQPLRIDGAVPRIYKSIKGVELRLHVFSPANHDSTKRQPAIVFFFGGGWTNANVEQFVPQAKHFAERGLVAIVADYRVFGRHKTSAFDAMSDARSSIRWVRSHAAELGIDPNRIVASGGSAGGHLALSAAVFGGSEDPAEDQRISAQPNALVLFNPVVDATVLPLRFDNRAQDGSPFHHLGRDLPPTVIFHGKADTTVPYENVERFCEKARTLGNRCELFGYDGATHGFFNLTRDNGKWYDLTLAEADQFLVSIKYLPSGRDAGR
jgi:acetyl esterase/lipase